MKKIISEFQIESDSDLCMNLSFRQKELWLFRKTHTFHKEEAISSKMKRAVKTQMPSWASLLTASTWHPKVNLSLNAETRYLYSQVSSTAWWLISRMKHQHPLHVSGWLVESWSEPFYPSAVDGGQIHSYFAAILDVLF